MYTTFKSTELLNKLDPLFEKYIKEKELDIENFKNKHRTYTTGFLFWKKTKEIPDHELMELYYSKYMGLINFRHRFNTENNVDIEICMNIFHFCQKLPENTDVYLSSEDICALGKYM